MGPVMGLLMIGLSRGGDDAPRAEVFPGHGGDASLSADRWQRRPYIKWCDWRLLGQQIRMNAVPTLDVEAVEAFVTIAELQSFTRAAAALGTTQGVISTKLRRLEERLGTRLIERTPRRVRLSAQGAVFLDHARQFLA